MSGATYQSGIVLDGVRFGAGFVWIERNAYNTIRESEEEEDWCGGGLDWIGWCDVYLIFCCDCHLAQQQYVRIHCNAVISIIKMMMMMKTGENLQIEVLVRIEWKWIKGKCVYRSIFTNKQLHKNDNLSHK